MLKEIKIENAVTEDSGGPSTLGRQCVTRSPTTGRESWLGLPARALPHARTEPLFSELLVARIVERHGPNARGRKGYRSVCAPIDFATTNRPHHHPPTAPHRSTPQPTIPPRSR